jgi:hypothetical protein
MLKRWKIIALKAIEDGVTFMNKKAVSLSTHPYTGRVQLVTKTYLNQIFLLPMMGIVAFLAIAGMLGSFNTAPSPEQSLLHITTQS